MATPIDTVDRTIWGGVVAVERRSLDVMLPIFRVQPLLRQDPNRVAWSMVYTSPGVGSIALPCAVSISDLRGDVSAAQRADFQLRANGDFVRLDVREDSDQVILPVVAWWMPTFGGATEGAQHVSVWEYLRIHGE